MTGFHGSLGWAPLLTSDGLLVREHFA
jgi:hypothetical protein